MILLSSTGPFTPACYQSHRAAWQKLLDQDLMRALILNQDVAPLNYDEHFLHLDLNQLGLNHLRLEEVELVRSPVSWMVHEETMHVFRSDFEFRNVWRCCLFDRSIRS